MDFLIPLLFARYSPFYLCPLLFSFVFLSPYSAYLGVLSNFLTRFSGLALRRLLFASFGRSVSLYPAYFSSLMTFLAAAKIQEAKAIFPLNSFFETREITNKQRQGIRGDVSLVIGPNGNIGGSYRFSGHAKE